MLNDADTTLLRQAPLFSALSPDELAQIAANARSLELETGALLFREGDKADAFYFIVSGGMRLFKLAPDGNEKVIELIQAGETFAEAVVFLGGRYPVYAAALNPARLLRIDMADFIRTLKANNSMAMKMLASISLRLHQLINDVRALSLETAGQRVAGYLLEHCPAQSGTAIFQLPAHKNVIASRLGIKPETFSRVLASLRDLGLVELDGPQIRIPDLGKLRHWRETCV